MTMITQRIAHLLSGVSQRPSIQRDPTQLGTQINMFGRVGHGLMKRPAAEHVAKLTATTTGWDDAFVHPIIRTDSERYRMVVVNGTVKVYDALTHADLTVETPDGTGYLSPTTDGFRAVTVGDTTFLVNRNKTVGKGTRKSARKSHEAFVYVTQADYDTYYAIQLGGVEFVYKTLDGADAQSRGAISTEAIAKDLKTLIEDNFVINMMYQIEQVGSGLYIQRFPLGLVDFDIEVADGLAGQGLRLIKDKVQVFEDLPRKCKAGMVVEVAGDPNTNKDNYYVKYENRANVDGGVWVECPKPGVHISLDPTTMPHRLVAQGQTVGETEAEQPPGQEPTISFETVSDTEHGWDEDNDGGGLDEEDEKEIQDEDRWVKKQFPTTDGDEREVKLAYAVDTSLVPNGVTTKVQLLHDDGITPVVITEKTYGPGEQVEDEEITGTMTPASGDKVMLRVQYGTGATPDVHRKARITAPSKTVVPHKPDGKPAIIITKHQYMKVDLPNVTYPKGVTIKLTLNSTDVFQTTTSADTTAASVATTLASDINADPSYTATNPVARQIRLENSPADFAQVPVRSEIYYASGAVDFYNSGLSLATNAFVNDTLVNLTDGSTGTITANTADTITVGSMSGGVDNDIQPGDVCYVEGTGTYFIFQQCSWDDREVGDDVTNEFPSFVDKKINEVFFHRNRLGFTSGETVSLSVSGDVYDFWRNTVTQLLADDRIDVQAASARVAEFHSAVLYNEDLYLWADNSQFVLGGEPVLSPETVSLPKVSDFFNNPLVRPLEGSGILYFAHHERGRVRVYAFQVGDESTPPDAFDLTLEIPAYIAGKVTDWAVDPGQGILALSTDSDVDSVYTFSWTRQGQQILQAGWSRWDLPPGSDIKTLDFIDGKLSMIVKRTDGIFLEEIDLDVDIAPGSAEQIEYLDRRMTEATTGVSSAFAGGNTTWTIPFNVNVDQSTEGKLVVVNSATMTRYTVTRPAANQVRVAGVDLTGANVYIGVIYTPQATLSPVYRRNRDGQAEAQGRLQLRYMEFFYHDTTDFDVQVTPPNGTTYTYSVAVAAPRDGSLRCSTPGRAEDVTVTVTQTDSPGGFRLSSVDWEGYYHNRSRRF